MIIEEIKFKKQMESGNKQPGTSEEGSDAVKEVVKCVQYAKNILEPE